MTGLSSKVSGSQMVEFFNRMGRLGNFTPERVARLNGDDELMYQWMTWLNERLLFHITRGRFYPLGDKLDMVRQYPGVTEEMIHPALAEARERIALFEKESPCNPLLDIVVCVYKDSAHETLKYARDRMRETHGDKFWQWDQAYAKNVDSNRVRYLQNANGRTIIPVYKNCVRIEVVDLGANWNKQNGMIPRDVRGANSAHAAVLYAAAQDPEWVRQMDGKKVPFALAGGFELNAPNCALWAGVPGVYHYGDDARLSASRYGDRYHNASLPSLWE